MNSEMKIGEVARRAGVRVDTVRYYERLGLVANLGRTSSGYRRFGAGAVERIRFAKELQGLGFSLDVIVGVLDDIDRGVAECTAERPRFEHAVARIDARIAELLETRTRLQHVLERCEVGNCEWEDRARALCDTGGT
jgi:DNA-binding transcriptional MerR regulator